MSKPSPSRYRTTNWSSYTSALRKRGSQLIWTSEPDQFILNPIHQMPGLVFARRVHAKDCEKA
jgi:hypothetical protein